MLTLFLLFLSHQHTATVQDRIRQQRHTLCVDIWTDVQVFISAVQDAAINIVNSTMNTINFIKLSG